MAINRLFGLTVLLLTLIFSALTLIYSKYYARLLFIEIEKQENVLDDFEVEWVQMQLEQTTLIEQNQVELAARRKKMVMPSRENIISIKP
jgi:cell division protein FtsL